MVTRGNQREDGEKNPRAATRSCGTTVSGQSVTTSGSFGSPSSRSELAAAAAAATPASESTFLRLNHLDIHGDDAGSQGAVGGRKKKRGQRAVGGDKGGRGLRQFSKKDYIRKAKTPFKVKAIILFLPCALDGFRTNNDAKLLQKCAVVDLMPLFLNLRLRRPSQVADELVAEFADPSNSESTPDQQQYDEKNIRRRVYDALNVLMAMDIISKDKKEIQWKGLPHTSPNDIEDLKTERIGLRNRIEKKAAYLQELQEQYIGLQILIRRNQQSYSSRNAPTGGVELPFILVQTRPHATVEVEISEDMQLVHFDFNSTPFELHDDNFVLKAMKFCERPQSDDVAHTFLTNGEESSMLAMRQAQIPNASMSIVPVRTPSSSPLPGILKARVKHEC
ncbi:Transcription factor DP, C-terminal [Dillenia turbinata]|uniref:Transcription factor DP, C-terminal n=1 Tax=Dillenia turbinata TaxID=194707 RepID=A0AAN8ZN78_9MAGN